MSSQTTFTRLHRPLGVRVYNAAARLLHKAGVPVGRLDVESLTAAARKKTGLDAFGEDGFREGLQRMLASYNEEAALTPAGRGLMRLNILGLLKNRLMIENEIRRDPGIVEQPVRRPLIIAAMPRTGTTLLYNLLSQDPKSRPLLTWEALFPVPRERERAKDPDPRIRRTALIIKTLYGLAPHLRTIHPTDPEGPEECSRLLMNTFVTSYALLEGRLPRYTEWLTQVPQETLDTAYRHYYRQLQLLQRQRPPRGHWLLKSPAHVFGVQSLLDVFPDACIVQIRRDPGEVLASTCSLFATYRGIFSDDIRTEHIGREVGTLFAEGLRRSAAARHHAEPGRVLDLEYRDLVADPIGTIRGIYDHFGYEYSPSLEQGAKGWCAHNPKDKHGKHHYTLEEFGLDRAEVARIFEAFDDANGSQAPERARVAPPHGSRRPSACIARRSDYDETVGP